MEVVQGTLSEKQIKELYTNPVTLVAAPGAGQALIVLACFVEYKYPGKLTYNSGPIAVTYGNRTSEENGQLVALADAPFDITEDTTQYLDLVFTSFNEPHGISSADCENKPLTLTADEDFYGGTGTGKYYLVYRTISI